MMPLTPPATGTVLQHVLGRAHERGDRPALVDLGGGVMYGYRRLLSDVTRAASALVRRGAPRGQAVGVYVGTVAFQTVAVQATIAAGGCAVLLAVGAQECETARRLVDVDARMLITGPDLAGAAVRLAEDSRVRQVVSFGAAVDTVAFRDLLDMEPGPLPVLDPNTQPALTAVDGQVLTHRDLLGRMAELDGGTVLTESDVVLVTWQPDGDPDLPALVGLALGKGCLVVAAPGGSGAELAGTAHDFGVTVITLPGGEITRL
ncbi:AMP-binding protein [Sinosporangium album]|nr:AMP-binding protein [Sinosporangium album]